MTDQIPDPFILTSGERDNALWLKLKRHMEELLKNARGNNDGDLDPVQTGKLRGRISVLKQLIALGDEPINLP